MGEEQGQQSVTHMIVTGCSDSAACHNTTQHIIVHDVTPYHSTLVQFSKKLNCGLVEDFSPMNIKCDFLGRPEQSSRTGLRSAADVFFRQPHLRGPSSDRCETLPHDRNLARIAQ